MTNPHSKPYMTCREVLDFLMTNRGPIRKSAEEFMTRLNGLLRLIDRGDASV